MKKIWTEDRVKRLLLPLVRDGKCPTAQELVEAKLYAGILVVYGSLDECCRKLDLKREYALHAHFEYDGRDYVSRSRQEADITLFLLLNNIPFISEKKLGGSRYRTDFFLVNTNTYIEYWGLASVVPSYDERRRKKLTVYAKHGLDLLELFPLPRRELFETLTVALQQRGYICTVVSDEASSFVARFPIKYKSTKFPEEIWFPRYLAIHKDWKAKYLEKEHPAIFAFIRANYGSYRRFLQAKKLTNKHYQSQHSQAESPYESYLCLAKELGYNPLPLDLKAKAPWLYGRIQRQFGSFRVFKKQFSISCRRTYPRKYPKGISLRLDKNGKLKKPWRVRLCQSGRKTINVGHFSSLEEATVALSQAKAKV